MKVGRGITRIKATEHLKRVLINANLINEWQLTAYRVIKIAVFGSYLDSDKDLLGDLDLWVWRERRDDTAFQAAMARAPKYILDLLRRYAWVENEFVHTLRGGHYPTISIHDANQHDLAKMGDYKIVWTADAS